jgi:hypothetical protein
MAEAFVKTFKRDDVDRMDRSEAMTVMRQHRIPRPAEHPFRGPDPMSSGICRWKSSARAGAFSPPGTRPAGAAIEVLHRALR